MDEILPLVMDGGSSMFRAGIAGEDAPTVLFPSVLGSPLFLKGDPDDRSTKDRFIGCENSERDFLSLRYPIERGIVSNWNDMEDLISHTYEQLKVNPEEYPVLFSQHPLNPRANKEHLAELMFESFNIPAINLADSSCLCLYACGRHSGVMVNVGDGVSFAVPFYESHCMTDGIQRQEFAGRDLTFHLQKVLYQKGHSFTTTSELEIVREMKEKKCCTALDYDSEVNLEQEPAVMNVTDTLSDRSDIFIKGDRFQCAEALFNPSKFGFDGFVGIQEMIYRAVKSCDISTRSDVIVNIILSGSSTLFPRFAERLKMELKSRFPPRRLNVVHYRDESPYSVWIGGSILASLSAFQASLISKQLYEEHGPSLVLKRFTHLTDY